MCIFFKSSPFFPVNCNFDPHVVVFESFFHVVHQSFSHHDWTVHGRCSPCLSGPAGSLVRTSVSSGNPSLLDDWDLQRNATQSQWRGRDSLNKEPGMRTEIELTDNTLNLVSLSSTVTVVVLALLPSTRPRLPSTHPRRTPSFPPHTNRRPNRSVSLPPPPLPTRPHRERGEGDGEGEGEREREREKNIGKKRDKERVTERKRERERDRERE